MRKDVSRATLGRVPVYLKYLKALPENEKYISATKPPAALSRGFYGFQLLYFIYQAAAFSTSIRPTRPVLSRVL